MWKQLLAAGAKVDLIASNGKTALDVAAERSHTEIIKLLLAAGTDNSNESGGGYTSPRYATEQTCDEVVQHARLKTGYPQLYEAVENDDIEAVNLLLRNGADVNAMTKCGRTVLHKAAKYGLEAMMELLLQAGAHVNLKTRSGKSSLYKASKHGHTRVVELLLTAGADVHARTNWGKTALYQASKEGHDEIVERLLAAGAKMDLTLSEKEEAVLSYPTL